MFDNSDLQHIQAAIERLDPDARDSLKRWLYLRPWEEDSDDHVAETAAKYQTHYMSIEEYLREEAVSTVRHEYVDGQMFAMSGARMRHSVICTNVFKAVANHLGRGPCRAFMENFKVSLQTHERNFLYYPDVMVTCGKHDLDSVHLNDPKLVIEVLSPSTARVDRNEKARNYRRIATLEEYVLIEQNQCLVTVQRRKDEWQSRNLDSVDQTLQLESIDLSLRLTEVYDGAE